MIEGGMIFVNDSLPRSVNAMLCYAGLEVDAICDFRIVHMSHTPILGYSFFSVSLRSLLKYAKVVRPRHALSALFVRALCINSLARSSTTSSPSSSSTATSSTASSSVAATALVITALVCAASLLALCLFALLLFFYYVDYFVGDAHVFDL